MRIKKWDTRGIKVHIFDWEDYNVTDDNGVDIYLTWYQMKRIAAKLRQERTP